MPRHIKQYDKYWVDTKIAYGALRNFVASLTRDTIQNARDITKIIVINHSTSSAFKTTMRSNIEDVRIGFLGGLITDAMMHFIFSSHFKASSFPFIFYQGVHPNPVEETI